MDKQYQTTLLRLIRLMRQKQNRYDASRTEGRYKEMKAAEKLVDLELEKWPAEVNPEPHIDKLF